MNNDTPITLDEVFDVREAEARQAAMDSYTPRKKLPPASRMPGYRAKLRERNERVATEIARPEWTVEGAQEWEAARAVRAYNQERAPGRALAHTLQLVNDLLGDVAEGDGDPATFATLTILVGTLGKLSRI